MSSFATETTKNNVATFVEVLTNSSGNISIGYRLGGFNPGPNVLVAAHAPIANLVFDRLIQLPSLGWMHGSLTLALLQERGRFAQTDDFGFAFDPKPDEILYLPYQADDQYAQQVAKESYLSVLRLCTRMGMITGRGVPAEITRDAPGDNSC